MDRKLKKLVFKTALFILSLSFAWYILKSGILNNLIEVLLPVRFLAEFVAGFLYTSFLTTPVALAMILILAQDSNPIILALLGGLGASLGDLIIVKFFRSKELSSDVDLAAHELHLNKINKFLSKWNLEFITPFLGALAIMSPFPDELGLMLIGASKLKNSQIFLITFFLNVAAILLVAVPVNLIL